MRRTQADAAAPNVIGGPVYGFMNAQPPFRPLEFHWGRSSDLAKNRDGDPQQPRMPALGLVHQGERYHRGRGASAEQ
jgi:hypothetical protein